MTISEEKPFLSQSGSIPDGLWWGSGSDFPWSGPNHQNFFRVNNQDFLFWDRHKIYFLLDS
jgi:hypothetical protein